MIDMANSVWGPTLQAQQNAISILMQKKTLDEDRRRFEIGIAEAKAERDRADREKIMNIISEAQKAKIKYAQDMMKSAYESGDTEGVRAFGEPLRQQGFLVPARQVTGGPGGPGAMGSTGVVSSLPRIQYFGAPQDQKNKATPTDIDDFVTDANAESIRLKGKPLTPGEKNEARLKFKRAQFPEVGLNRLASRNVDIQTAQRIKYNEGIGKALAEIETAGEIIKAKGDETPQQKKEIAKSRMTGNLATMANHYVKLDTVGAIINTNKSTIENIGAALKSSAAGQYIGRITGSEAQSIRSSIAKLKPLIIQDIRQSTNMGARGLDSEKELEFYLQAATNEKTDIQSNIAAIVVLDEAFGTGETAKKLRAMTNESLIKRISEKGLEILNGGKESDADRRARELIEQYGKK